MAADLLRPGSKTSAALCHELSSGVAGRIEVDSGKKNLPETGSALSAQRRYRSATGAVCGQTARRPHAGVPPAVFLPRTNDVVGTTLFQQRQRGHHHHIAADVA
jgi:hypothetical protein